MTPGKGRAPSWSGAWDWLDYSVCWNQKSVSVSHFNMWYLPVTLCHLRGPTPAVTSAGQCRQHPYSGMSCDLAISGPESEIFPNAWTLRSSEWGNLSCPGWDQWHLYPCPGWLSFSHAKARQAPERETACCIFLAPSSAVGYGYAITWALFLSRPGCVLLSLGFWNLPSDLPFFLAAETAGVHAQI